MRTEQAFLIAIAFVTGCGSGGDGSLTGPTDAGISEEASQSTGPSDGSMSIAGRTLEAVDTFARKDTLVSSGSTLIEIVSRAGACSGGVRPERLADATFLHMAIPRRWPPPPGVYPIVDAIHTFEDGGSTMGAFAYFEQSSPTCEYVGRSSDAKAIGGSVTVETSTNTAVTGTFDLRFPGGQLQASYVASLCEVPLDRTKEEACVP